MALAATHAKAASEQFATYTFEVAPTLGITLPYDAWGTRGTLSMIGIRSALSISPQGSIEVSAIAHHAGPDRAYSLDASYRYEMATDAINAYFTFGMHFTRVSFTVDYDENGACIPANCLTDSGNTYGVLIGGGLQVPISPMMPLRLGMRFQKNPTLWLLLEAGLGFRF